MLYSISFGNSLIDSGITPDGSGHHVHSNMGQVRTYANWDHPEIAAVTRKSMDTLTGGVSMYVCILGSSRDVVVTRESMDTLTGGGGRYICIYASWDHLRMAVVNRKSMDTVTGGKMRTYAS